MALMDEVKSRFPLWNKYCLDDAGDPQDSVLQIDMDRSLATMQDYIPDLTFANLTDSLEEHFVNIVARKAWGRKHDVEEFEHQPTVVKDYDRSLKMLERYKLGEFGFDPTPDDDTDDTETVSMAAKDRKFGDDWFNE